MNQNEFLAHLKMLKIPFNNPHEFFYALPNYAELRLNYLKETVEIKIVPYRLTTHSYEDALKEIISWT